MENKEIDYSKYGSGRDEIYTKQCKTTKRIYDGKN